MRYKIEFELPDNDTVLKEIKHASVGWQIWGYSGIAKPVPSIDAVQVVRCKDCKYAHMTYDGDCKYCDVWFPDEAEYLDGDYYCASAERKEE